MIRVKPALSVSCAHFFITGHHITGSRDPIALPARARAHHPRARASFSVTLSTRAPVQSARARRRQAAGISRRDRRMAPRGAVLRPRRFPPERCRGCSASLGVVIGEAGRSAGAKATTKHYTPARAASAPGSRAATRPPPPSDSLPRAAPRFERATACVLAGCQYCT